MNNRSGELAQGNGDASLPSSNPQPVPLDRLRSTSSNKVFKSGPLFISSKGIGWTSWKKRWFILTQTSLVFFRSDPSVVSQKGNEVNLTLGGIDLNNSGSVVVKSDRKILIVQFPDSHNVRAFTLKAETTEDLYEWKTALENVLAHAPSPTNVMGQHGIFRSGQADSVDIYLGQLKDRETVKNAVLGRPILLALEEVDGTPSFLEKALRFIEVHGYKVEGILRQSADVDDVENRVREYEQGKVEFSQEEDAHVIADCVKHVLRELPSSPVPASCCKALLEACRTARGNRVSAMRTAICDTFPEPNRRLLQRILLMMQTIVSGKAENRMSSSAVAACMAPLLLRPLLAGDCEIENDFDVGGDGSLQLLQAAAAANHAQSIVITLLEEYNSIFWEGSVSPAPDIYMDSEDNGSDSEEATDDDLSYDDYYDDEQDESIEESDVDADDLFCEANSETAESTVNDEYDDEDIDLSKSSSKFSEVCDDLEVDQVLSTTSARKNLSIESVDYLDEYEAEVEKLEAVKTELESQVAEEVKVNAKLQSVVETRKKALQERRLVLEQNVARLQEQLLKEKTSRANLEAGLKFPPGTLSEISGIDERTKADLEGLVLIEADLLNIEWKINQLGFRLKEQLEHGSMLNFCNEPQQISNHERNVYERKPESTSLPNKHPPSSKKSGTRGEQGANSTSSTLIKLTSKLNFLKERRNQFSNELQNMDKGKGTKLHLPLPSPSKSRGFDSHLSLLSPNKYKGNELHLPVSTPNKSRGWDFYIPLLSPNRSQGYQNHSPPKPEKGRGNEVHPFQNSDKFRKSDNQPHHSDGQNEHSQLYLKRGISEGRYQSYNVDKGHLF